ncbi:hypothetical protein GJ496_007370 [Pomphorhynchus laevis]|nr:hypothetical protein GJ496_007370 [Pomphorhynchus laevis]
MFRNMYDNDVSTWSPQGRLYQIEYAMEAVKQGSVTIALKSKQHVVLCALKRAPSKLSAHQKKIGVIDEHVGFSMAGLASDARVLLKFLRLECISHRYEFGKPIPCKHLMERLIDHCQPRTMLYGQRPYGVGLLIGCYDDNGPHLYQFCPSSTYYDCRAMALGARSQSARTYFEKHLDLFNDCTLDELIHHGLLALKETLPNDVELTCSNCSIGIIGKDKPFMILDQSEELQPYLNLIKSSEGALGSSTVDSHSAGTTSEEQHHEQ